MGTQVREVTEQEVAAFRENGWALLPGLIDPAFAAELVEQAKVLLSTERDDGYYKLYEGADDGKGGKVADVKVYELFSSILHASEKDEVFRSLAASPAIGRNVSASVMG